MGILYRQYSSLLDSALPAFLMKFIFFLGVTGAYLALILFFAAYRIMPWSGFSRELDMMLVLFPAYPLFWGLMLGIGADSLGEVKYVLYVPMTMAIPMVPLSAVLIGYHIKWYFGILAFPLLAGAFFLPYLLENFLTGGINTESIKMKMALRMKKGLTAEQAADKPEGKNIPPVKHLLNSAWIYVIIPAGSAAALLLWQNMTMEMLEKAYANWKLPPDTDFIFVSLFISGIIPLRALAQLAPPIKPGNFLISAAALAYYIIMLYRYMH
jgi:hypothetical protein